MIRLVRLKIAYSYIAFRGRYKNRGTPPYRSIGPQEVRGGGGYLNKTVTASNPGIAYSQGGRSIHRLLRGFLVVGYNIQHQQPGT